MVREYLHLKIQNREEVIYEADVLSVSSVNDKGKFDVLPEHANFISLIQTEIAVRDGEGKERKFPIEQGVLRVFQNQVKIFLGI